MERRDSPKTKQQSTIKRHFMVLEVMLCQKEKSLHLKSTFTLV